MIDVIYHLRHEIASVLAVPGAVLLVFLFARRLPDRRNSVLRRLRSIWQSLARRPVLATILLCVLQMSCVAIHAAVSGAPNPFVHDEFSYLLAGDTFSSGRLTNPTHPMWVHFESPHVIQTPTRMSMYPPGQGLVLAAGFVLGHPWIGVILSTLLMIALVYWAARQWMPPSWALLVGLFGLTMVLGTYWTNSYWGGALNASAGALVAGSAAVLRKRPSTAHLTLFAAGVVLCAITRPYEGTVLVSLFSSWLAWCILRQGRPVVLAHLRRCLPPLLLLAASGSAFLYYNFRVTGKPLTMPYNVAAKRYLASRMFLFQDHPPVPEYRHPVMKDIYVGLRRSQQAPHWRLHENFTAFRMIYLSTVLFPFFVFSLCSVFPPRRRKLRPPILISLGGLAAILALPWINPHYYAPFATCFLIAVVASLRGLRAFRFAGQRPGWILSLLAVAVLTTQIVQAFNREAVPPPQPRLAWAAQRAAMLKRLASGAERHLIIVRYSPEHNWYNEWVYNQADIDGSPVVWAREMNPARDAELLRYFSSRRAWLLEADAVPPRLIPYPGADPTPLPRPTSQPDQQR